jgi:signal peptidase I
MLPRRCKLQRPLARHASQILRRVLLAVLVAWLALTLARSYIGDVYRVESTSMEPTLHASPEQVFVRYERGFTPQRSDLVVFTPPAPESGAVVKRVAGLPGESVLISGGDLLIEGRRLGSKVKRPLPIAIFDSALEPIEAAFTAAAASLEKTVGGWRLDARGRRQDLTLARRPQDDRYDANGKFVQGSREVNDLRIEGRFLFEGTGKFTLRLTEEGDGFELELEVREGVVVNSRILRRAGSAELAVLAQVDQATGNRAGEVCTVAFENVDNHLQALVGGISICTDYDSNTPLAGVVDTYRHLQPRANLAVAELRLTIERLTVARDLYYTAEGALGTGSPVALGPDEIFVLGDNSSDSRDSRVFGPVRLEELAGRATMVLWPLSAARRLGELRSLVPAPAK